MDTDLVFAEILLKLPVKSLMRFKCVSKLWLARISGDSSFINAHRIRNNQAGDGHLMVVGCYRYYGNDLLFLGDRQRMTLHSDRGLKTRDVDVSYVIAKYGAIEIIGSCNGLVCLFSSFPGVPPKHKILLWNPATRQLRKLPKRPNMNINTQCIGFGFDSASGDYKVVYLSTEGSENEPVLYANVFVKSGAVWRGGEEERGVLVSPDLVAKKSAVEANGAMHWVAFNRDRRRGSFVFSFGLSDEVLRVSDGPGGGECVSLWLLKWRASLAAVSCSESLAYVTWEATSIDSELRWDKLFEIRERIGRFLGDFSNTIIFLERKFRRLQMYDPNVSGVVTEIELPDICWELSHSNNYVETIVSVF